jgi:adenylate kinase
MNIQTDLILFGIQGAGKGTQAKALAERYSLYIFETGAQLRNIMKGKSVLGQTVREIVQRGDLVPNEIVMKIVEHFLYDISPSNFVLFDGIPRSLLQKETFDLLLREKKRTAKGIFLEVPKNEVMKRMKDRGREDDTNEVIERRIKNYEDETLPVIQAYKEEGKILRINGFQPLEDVSKDIFCALEAPPL